MPSLARRLAALVLVAAPACAEAPAFEARWRLAGDDGGPPVDVTSVRLCTEAGIRSIRVTSAPIGGGAPVDVRDLPCFPAAFADPAGRAPGPELDPGEYRITFEGVLRSGATICQVQAEGADCDIARTITVAGAGPVDLDDLVVPRAPQCRDGVDNDRDGRTDGADPGCQFDGAREDNDLTRAYVALRATFLDQNPHATCVGVGAASLRAEIRPDGSDVIAHSERLPCAKTKQLFDVRLDPGVYELTVVAATASDQDLARDAPVRFCVPRPDPSDDGCSGPAEKDLPRLFLDLAPDFAIDEFTAPITSPLRFVVEYEPAPGYPRRGCDPVSGGGTLKVDAITVDVWVVDAQGVEQPIAVALADGEPLADPLPCPIASLTTEPLEWSPAAREYRLALTATSPEGDACFATDARIRGAPGATFLAVVPRASSAGSCADCTTSDECSKGCTDEGLCRL